jgi:hypothetical protein
MDREYRHLRADKLVETAERLARRVGDRFPGSGLSNVAAAVVDVTREAIQTAERINRPNWWLRGGLIALLLLVVAGGVVAARELSGTPMDRLREFMTAAAAPAAYAGVVVLFFVTLEVRFKRRKAVRAVHELRALAHLIDMHQLAKDPERPGATPGAGAPMTAESMGYYFNYCTDLLALVSKIGQLYVEDFADSTVLAAVDHFENLATGLSQKIWQKLMILDRIRGAAPVPGPADEKGAAQPPAVASPSPA